jgi:hypothetical protein
MASAVGNVTLTASGRVWRPSATVDERIEALRKHITEVEGRLNDVARKLREETAESRRDRKCFWKRLVLASRCGLAHRISDDKTTRKRASRPTHSPRVVRRPRCGWASATLCPPR